jgi:hypothetical protein
MTAAPESARAGREHPDQPGAHGLGISSGWTLQTYDSATEYQACESEFGLEASSGRAAR